MPDNCPRRPWHNSMIVPTNSDGAMIVHLATGSKTSLILPSGQSDGLVTTSSVPSSMCTW